jgi:hypothetical protein
MPDALSEDAVPPGRPQEDAGPWSAAVAAGALSSPPVLHTGSLVIIASRVASLAEPQDMHTVESARRPRAGALSGGLIHDPAEHRFDLFGHPAKLGVPVERNHRGRLEGRELCQAAILVDGDPARERR